jgi:hypothetical protein
MGGAPIMFPVKPPPTGSQSLPFHRAMPVMVSEPDRSNSPQTYRSPLYSITSYNVGRLEKLVAVVK